MKVSHNFLDGCFPVPDVDVKDINKSRSERLQRAFKGVTERFCIVAVENDLLLSVRISKLVVEGIL